MPCAEFRSEVQRAGKSPLRRPALRPGAFGYFWRAKSNPAPGGAGTDLDKDVFSQVSGGLNPSGFSTPPLKKNFSISASRNFRAFGSMTESRYSLMSMV